MNILSLCSGIGGFDRGIRLAIPSARTVCYVEINPFCQAILVARMADRVFDRAPIWGDLRTFDGRPWRGVVDCVASGFPCQPFSHAGKRKGERDERNLWPEVRRIIAESEPAIVVLENVPGALPYFFHVVLPELQELGYAAQAGLFTAAEVGAPHKRQRVFVLAHQVGRELRDEHWWSGGTDRSGKTIPRNAGIIVDDAASPRRGGRKSSAGATTRDEAWGREPSGRRDAMGDSSDDHGRPRINGAEAGVGESGERGRGFASASADVGHPDESSEDARSEGRGSRHPIGEPDFPIWPPGPTERDRWVAILARWPDLAPAMADTKDGSARSAGRGQEPRGPAEGDALEPPLRRVVDGLPSRMDRLRALGNAVVPEQAAYAIRVLMEWLP